MRTVFPDVFAQLSDLVVSLLSDVCLLGDAEIVRRSLSVLDAGATTFWEGYDLPLESRTRLEPELWYNLWS